MKNKIILETGALLLMLAVVLGAFGAHQLEKMLPADRLDTFETGVRYQFYHGLGILMIGLLCQWYKERFLVLSARAMMIGVLLFSGSIYLLACRDLIGLTSWKWLGPITPLGGTFLIASWLLLFLALRKIPTGHT